MDRITRHIINALQESECVVIPSLGAILRHSVPSKHLSSSHTLTAPYAVLGFNPQLRLSDGLLLGAYMREERMDPEMAQRVLGADVRNLTRALERNAEYYMEDLGTFRMDISGRISFHPQSEQFSLGALLGLSDVVMPTLEDIRRKKAIEASERLIREKIQGGRTTRTFPVWQTVAAAAVTVLVILGVMVGSGSGMGNVSKAFLSLEEIFKAHPAQPKAKASEPAFETKTATSITSDTNLTDNTISDSVTERKAMTDPSLSEVSVQPLRQKSYHVIIASLGSPDEAIDMARQLVLEGHHEAKAILLDGKNRVSLSSLGTLEEATAIIQQLQSAGEGKDAWILRR